MDRTLFRKPVSVLVGLGYPAKVESASQAYQLLNELPFAKSNPACAVAVKACRLAMEGAVEPETARSAFVAFARRMAMLNGESGQNETAYIPKLQAVQARRSKLPAHSSGK